MTYAEKIQSCRCSLMSCGLSYNPATYTGINRIMWHLVCHVITLYFDSSISCLVLLMLM